MNRSPQSHSSVGSTLARMAFVFSVLLLSLLIGVFVAGATVLRAFKPPTDRSGLRSELLTCLEGSRVSSIEVAIPSWVATLGRVGVSLAAIDPDIKAAIQPVKGGQVGVYEFEECPSRKNMMTLLEVADRELEGEGWLRMVTVLEDSKLVVVYGLDSSPRSGQEIEAFVIVVDQHKVVIACATGYTDPLIQLASSALVEVAEVGVPKWSRQ